LILCSGSYTQINGGPELRCMRQVEWAELVEGGERSVYSSDVTAVGDTEMVSQPETAARDAE
jgi:hypothetical protein